MSKPITMRYPDEILEKINIFKKKNGFTTRTQTIIFLIHYALEKLLSEENNNK